MMVIRHNKESAGTLSILSDVYGKRSKALGRISSGMKIRTASDDAAGYAISERMRVQIRSLDQSKQNAQNGMSLLKVAEGSLDGVRSLLLRGKEMALSAANDSNTDADRRIIQKQWDEITAEIEDAAGSAEFNGIRLLSGQFSAHARGYVPIDVYRDTSLPIIESLVTYPVVVRKTGEEANPYREITPELTAAIQTEILPQSVRKLLDTFPETFGYLQHSNLGIGFSAIRNPKSSVLASVTLKTSYTPGLTVDSGTYSLGYRLYVNTAKVQADGSADGITDASRLDLEKTITHEMMHAMMFESLTAPMLGWESTLHQPYPPIKAAGFPDWFVEGTAQAASGGSDWVTAMGISDVTDEAAIQRFLSAAPLTSGTTASKYGTGYLASMYLGSLASGGATDAKSVAHGLDLLLKDVRDGMRMDEAIRQHTNGRYQSTADFTNRFGTEPEELSFIKTLVKAYTNNTMGASDGTGGLVAGDYRTSDLLPDAPAASLVFFLDTGYVYVVNHYPSGYAIFSGGTQGTNGISPFAGTPGGSTGGNAGGSIGGGGGIAADAVPRGLRFHIGAKGDDSLMFSLDRVDRNSLGIDRTDMRTRESAQNSISILDAALESILDQLTTVGAMQTRLDLHRSMLTTNSENTQRSESTIRDADMAKEMTEFVKYNILQQGATAMLSHANTDASNVLALLP